MILSTPLILVFLLIYYIVIPTIFLFIKNKKVQTILNIVYTSIFICLLFVGVFGEIAINKTNTTINFNFTNAMFAKSFNFKIWKIDLQDFLINISMLFPLGYVFVSFIKNKHVLLISLLLGFCVGTFIEIMQFILPVFRSPQLSDIILNGLSVLIGAVYFYLIKKFRDKKNKKIGN